MPPVYIRIAPRYLSLGHSKLTASTLPQPLAGRPQQPRHDQFVIRYTLFPPTDHSACLQLLRVNPVTLRHKKSSTIWPGLSARLVVSPVQLRPPPLQPTSQNQAPGTTLSECLFFSSPVLALTRFLSSSHQKDIAFTQISAISLMLATAAVLEGLAIGMMLALALATTPVNTENLHVCILGSCETAENASVVHAPKDNQIHTNAPALEQGQPQEQDTKLRVSSKLIESI